MLENEYFFVLISAISNSILEDENEPPTEINTVYEDGNFFLNNTLNADKLKNFLNNIEEFGIIVRAESLPTFTEQGNQKNKLITLFPINYGKFLLILLKRRFPPIILAYIICSNQIGN